MVVAIVAALVWWFGGMLFTELWVKRRIGEWLGVRVARSSAGRGTWYCPDSTVATLKLWAVQGALHAVSLGGGVLLGIGGLELAAALS